MNVSNYFAHWLCQDDSMLTGRDVEKLPAAILTQLVNEDLVAVMYFGDEVQAIMALRILKRRFEEEMNNLEQMNRGYDD
jgi:hypothetical protein